MNYKKTEELLSIVNTMETVRNTMGELVLEGNTDESIMILYLLGVKSDIDKLKNILETQVESDKF